MVRLICILEVAKFGLLESIFVSILAILGCVYPSIQNLVLENKVCQCYLCNRVPHHCHQHT